MAETSEIRKIQCPQCAAPIPLYGGKDVFAIVCSHCGACLDGQDEFKFLKKFKSVDRPDVALKIGMTGVIQNISFVIIGIVEFTQRDEWGNYPWVEFLLFSKTHGYAWLCYENGHYVFGREVKDAPVGRAITFNEPIFKTTIYAKDKRFKVFECAPASITYVEGELTWRASIGDKIEYLDAISPPSIYCVEQNSTETEYFFGEYVSPQEIHKGFGLSDKPKKPEGVFSCQPFSTHPLLKGMASAGAFYAILSTALLFSTLSFFRGEAVFHQYVETSPSQETEYPFTVTNSKGLMSMDVHSPLSNAWADFDVSILDDDDNEIYLFSKNLSYYHGYEGGESWSEGTQSAKTYFKVPETGTYKFVINAEGGQGEWASDLSKIGCTVTIKQGCKVSRYFLTLLASMLLFAGVAYLEKYFFERKRWEDYYEELEDDDD